MGSFKVVITKGGLPAIFLQTPPSMNMKSSNQKGIGKQSLKITLSKPFDNTSRDLSFLKTFQGFILSGGQWPDGLPEAISNCV